jgi:hypothetical protein
LVERKFKDPATGRGRLYRGVLEFQGPDSGPHYFVAAYEDGDRQPITPSPAPWSIALETPVLCSRIFKKN